jgi:hypothetical protein
MNWMKGQEIKHRPAEVFGVDRLVCGTALAAGIELALVGRVLPFNE